MPPHPLLFCSLQPDYISDYVSDCSVSSGSPTPKHCGSLPRRATQRRRSFLRWRTRESHQTRLTGRRGSGEAAQGGQVFLLLPSRLPRRRGRRVRGHCHCVPSSAKSSLVSRQPHNRQHSWERGRGGTCFHGLFV